jgi:hypothetical protein
MYYSTGVAGLAAFGAATAVPHDGVLWHIARLTLDYAGGLFGIYLLAILGLSLAGGVLRARGKAAGPRARLTR